MKFNTRLSLCAVVPAVLFVAALATSIGGLFRTQSEFNNYLKTEQAVANGLSDMYAQGLQMGQALRNVVLDAGNKKSYDNFVAAKEAYERAYSRTSRPHAARLSRSR